ncbi:hypothetical protein HYS48_03945, partial [Candidatus Woesearchaeota archaeon]|nr:hypothetical protein [Candidatus Woesearchaeota archaeon]
MTYFAGCCGGYGGHGGIEQCMNLSSGYASGGHNDSEYNAGSYAFAAAPVQPYNLEAAVMQEYNPVMMHSEARVEHAPLQLYPTVHYRFPETSYAGGYGVSKTSAEHFSPEPFLKPWRPVARFIGSAEEIQQYLEEAFEKTTGKKLPEDMVISVLPKEEMQEKHALLGGIWSEGIQGFCLNNRLFGDNFIVVKQNDLDKLLITVGHEIGHVLSLTLPEKVSEEAKAF